MEKKRQDTHLSAALERLKRDFPGHAADIGSDAGGLFEAVIRDQTFRHEVVASARCRDTAADALDGALDALATRRSAEALS